MDANQLFGRLSAADIDVSVSNLSIADRSYRAIKREFLEREFSVSIKAWIYNLFGAYKSEVRDCDDFARFVAATAQIWNSETADNGGHALAFGECWYEKENGQGHAVNIAVVDGGEVVFYEPQTQRIVELTEREKWSGISEIRF